MCPFRKEVTMAICCHIDLTCTGGRQGFPPGFSVLSGIKLKYTELAYM
jgi:hypothetical protein